MPCISALLVLLLQRTLMAHALKRIAFATCFPDQHQFSFIAREPRSTTDEQFCHAFRARSAHEVSLSLCVVFCSECDPKQELEGGWLELELR